MTATELPELSPRSGDALIVVDVQRDFLPGGALAVPDGDRVVPALNRYLRLFASRSLPVFATRDWHPPDHCSFREQGGPWPRHCVAGSQGARLAEGLELPETVVIISTAVEPDVECYSGFERTDLEQRLRESGIRRLFVGGLATDYCVLATVKDAISYEFSVVLLTDAVRGVNVQPGDADRAQQEMVRLGAIPLCWEEIS